MNPVSILILLAALFSTAATAETPEDVPMFAVSLVGSPYRLGGNSPETGLDCSGFVNYVFRTTTGIQLPRDSLSLSEATAPLAESELRPGDLVFSTPSTGPSRTSASTSARTALCMPPAAAPAA